MKNSIRSYRVAVITKFDTLVTLLRTFFVQNILIAVLVFQANQIKCLYKSDAYLFACGVGALFSLGVNLIALRKINKLNLTHVNSN